MSQVSKYFTKNYLEPEQQAELSGISGSGGGCFPEGTLVRTAAGLRCIDKILPGESVVSYDRHGELSLAYVTEVLTHKTNPLKEKLYFIYSKGISLFPKGITGNHAVFCKQENNHKKVEELKIGEALCTMEGEELPISLILRNDLAVPVYNLIVEPTHTYLVGTTDLLIKVHNGGGGKDSAEPRAAQEAPNTLQSSAIAKVLEVISHGEIVGIVGGAKGVTFNNTVLQNPDNSFNFENILFTERKGLPSQLPIPGFEETESEVSITPIEITSSSVIQQLPNSNIPVARVTIRLPGGLWRQNKTNGDLLGYSVSFTIDVKERTSGTWSNVITKTINDKTRSPWEIAYRLTAPIGAVQWDIRITRTSAEDGTADKSSVLFFQRITEITNDNLSYPDIAYVGLEVAAASTGNRIPSRAYLVKGLLVEVPNIYDTVLRTYGAAYWTGVFKTEWTDNTAWVLYALITNTEWGLADFLGQTIDVDIFAFYEAALYCDATVWTGTDHAQTLLPDGEGGFEVRFKFNTVIQVQSDAWQLLQAVASNMNAIVIMKGGQISLIQDRPKVVSRLFNNSNVIDGSFLYSSSQSSDRATAVNCTFNDKFDRFLPRTISEDDAAAITKFGHSSKDIVAYGSVTESQSRRACKAVLYNELNLVDNVAFSVGLNIIDVEIGSIISIMDNEYVSDQNTYLSGRVSGILGQVVSLDRPITLDAGHTYTFGIMSLDYKTIDEYTITDAPGMYTELTVTGAIPVGDYANHEFFCYSSGYIEPRLFQVLSITEAEKGIYAIFGMFYNPDKFAAIEQGLSVVLPIYSNLIDPFVPAVTNITFQEIYLNNNIVSENTIIVQWDWAPNSDLEIVEYNLHWRRDNGSYTFVPHINLKEFTIPSVVSGVYEVIISVKNLQNKVSVSTLGTHLYRTIAGASTLEPPINLYVKDTADTVFLARSIPLVWDFPLTNELKLDTIQRYKIEVYDAPGTTLINTYYAGLRTDRGGEFEYTESLNLEDFGTLQRDVHFKVYSVDMIGELSIAVSANFTNPQPIASFAPTFYISSGQVTIEVDPPSIPDYQGMVVSVDTVTGFTPSLANAVYVGTDTVLVVPNLINDTEYFIRFAAYDAFGTDDLVFHATEYVVTPNVLPMASVDAISINNGTTEIRGDGTIWLFNADQNVNNRDYALLSAGLLNYFIYRDSAYHEYKSLKRRVSGVANSGDIVVIPGYFESQPEIILSTKDLVIYDAGFGLQDQKLLLDATNITEFITNQWLFTATANNSLAASSGNIVINDTSGIITTNTYTTALQTTPENTTEITINVEFRSKRSTGASPNYYDRSVKYRYSYRKVGDPTWILTTYKTVVMPLDIASVVNDFEPLTGLVSAQYEFTVEFEAFDTDGTTFVSGVLEYEYDTVNRSSSSNSGVFQATTGVKDVWSRNTNTLPALASYTPSAPWAIYNVNYSVTLAWETRSFNASEVEVRNMFTGGNIFYLFDVSGFLADPDEVHGNISSFFSHNFSSASYNTSAFSIRVSAVNRSNGTWTGGYSKAQHKNPTAAIQIRRPKVLSSTPENVFTLKSYDYDLSTAVVLAVGSLNWTAIGD